MEPFIEACRELGIHINAGETYGVVKDPAPLKREGLVVKSGDRVKVEVASKSSLRVTTPAGKRAEIERVGIILY